MTDILERDIYALICGSDGIKAREIARRLHADRGVVNRYLYGSPYIHDLCYHDEDYRWHGYIRQARPHRGLEDYSGYYASVREFLETGEEEWFEQLREGCRSARDRAIVEVLRSTGARVGELVAINTADINWQTGDILIQSEKSGRYRTIYLDEVARYHLQKYISQREDDDPALFVASRRPFERLHTCGIRNILKQIAKRMGMECRVYPHKMRSTLGMNLRNSGVDIGDVSEVLGHANTTVTKKHYAQATPETLRGIRRRAVA